MKSRTLIGLILIILGIIILFSILLAIGPYLRTGIGTHGNSEIWVLVIIGFAIPVIIIIIGFCLLDVKK